MAVTKTVFDIRKISRPVTSQKLAITVLSGGPGSEREVSLESGKAVADALQSLGHAVHVADINPDNIGALARQVDCVFVALHGRFGEDGQVQGLLERRKLAYVGSGPDACRLAMNKARAKERFVALGIPTPRWTVATRETIREAVAAWTLPVVVKPVMEGSSVNCHIVTEFKQFRLAIEQLVAEYGECLVEEFIPGRELTVGILGNEALPPIEIRTPRPFYDYSAKYQDDQTQYLFDTDLPEGLPAHLQQMSLAVHEGLGCRDFSRLDWRLDSRTNRPSLLEINVIPGLTTHSLLPKAAAQSGRSMAEMCQTLVELAIKRRFSR